MGFRFRKSINLLSGVRVNLSKSGVGYSFGTKGARVTKTANGITRTTASIPNTGLSYVKESGGNKKKNKTANKMKMSTEVSQENDNMFNKFNLSEKELELFEFIFNHQDELSEEFSMHEVSCMGCVISDTYYNKLYNKGLLLKPNRGKYKLNIELLTKLAKEKEEAEKETERLAKAEIARREEVAEANKKIRAWVCRIFFIPMLVFGLLFILAELYSPGIIAVIIGILEFIYSRKYFKKRT